MIVAGPKTIRARCASAGLTEAEAQSFVAALQSLELRGRKLLALVDGDLVDVSRFLDPVGGVDVQEVAS